MVFGQLQSTMHRWILPALQRSPRSGTARVRLLVLARPARPGKVVERPHRLPNTVPPRVPAWPRLATAWAGAIESLDGTSPLMRPVAPGASPQPRARRYAADGLRLMMRVFSPRAPYRECHAPHTMPAQSLAARHLGIDTIPQSTRRRAPGL
jgi:hypothetical protein